jgi:hypothetical protein
VVDQQTEGRIEGDGYCASWKRNDRPWGHAIDAKIFDPTGEPIGSASFVCHPEFADYERYQQMATEELVRAVNERLQAIMDDDSIVRGWSRGLHVIFRFNDPLAKHPNIGRQSREPVA